MTSAEVPMKLKSGMWNADVDFDLAAFHSLVRLATCRNPAHLGFLWFFGPSFF
jgi:hypothetical protein